MIAWNYTARIYFFNLKSLNMRQNLIWLRWGNKSGSSLFNGKHSLIKTQALAKTTLLCWGIKEVSVVRCQETSNQCALLFPEPAKDKQPLAGFFWNLGFALRLGLRACILLLKFGPLLLLYPVTYLSSGFTALWFHLLLKATESSGPTYIKLGQWACTRRDLFSEEFCTKFSKLHVKVPPHPWGYTKYFLRRTFGEDWKRVLKFKSKEPIGSGCIAQVYKAYADSTTISDPQFEELVKNSETESAFEAWEVCGLRGLFRWPWKGKAGRILEESSEDQSLQKGHLVGGINRNATSEEQMDHLIPVAIKVLHPGLVHQVQLDLLLMKMGSKLIGLFPGFKWLSLTEIVEEFEKLMTQQLDLRYEARNLEHFQKNFLGVDFVKFPTPLRPFVTRNILVETFEESEPISQYLHADVSLELKQKLAKIGMDMLLKMVFVDNFVHADLHPGNILVQGITRFNAGHKDQTTIVDMCDTLVVEVQPSPCPLRLMLLDAGIVAELKGADLQNFKAVFTAVVQGQGERVAELILHHSRANQCKDIKRFKAEMAELVSKARMNTVVLGKLQVANLLSSVFNLLMTHKAPGIKFCQRQETSQEEQML
ncbi:putative aarF domain-containing protein kinase 2 isoform X2 [Carettochelys insculpta]|uniref:putative aarF domain-containing protein kinase 2 isoform X2 n=1 Tax=Carettochelys insculpta TaxID=44489 RepID=UPI003EBC1C39